jgi:hypothetical protein
MSLPIPIKSMASKWLFPTQKSGLTDYHSIPTEKALDSKLETFIREVLQNSNDQGLDNNDPVEVYFRFEELTGSELDKYLEALAWEDELKSHIVGATENEQARDPGLQRFLNEFDEERLLVLTIEDRNTTGLEGDETDNSQPYGALVKDFGGSEKPNASSGGSHGVGKTVLWAFSGISTVLFCSNPRNTPQFENLEPSPPRLVGRSILPAHDHQDETLSYTNHGWFGFDDDEEVDRIGRPRSMWANDDGWSDTAEALQLSRDTETTGTNISVVGFRIPGEEINPDPDELADDFLTASVKHFWPAMERGELEVYVETPDGQEHAAELDHAPGVKPFASAFAQRDSDPGGELTEPGSVVKTDVDLTVPAENPELVESPHDKIETDVDLLVRQLTPGDTDDVDSEDDDLSAKNVARMRGANMIVDYVTPNNLGARSKEFVGVMIAGEGRTDSGETASSEDEAVEKFLKRSEPTQHDDWVGSGNDYLKKYYTGTIVKEVEGLSGSRLTAALDGLVNEEIEAGADIPSLSDRIQIMSGRNDDVTQNGTASTLDWEKNPSPVFEDGRWRFSGKVGPSSEDHGNWELEIELVEYDEEDKKAGEIDVSSITPNTGGVTVTQNGDGMKLEVDASMDTIEFEGESVRRPDPDFEVGDIALTEVVVASEISAGGDDS